jgi:hypothetical protein
MRWTRQRRATNGAFADGQAVWSWHPDADVKFATTLSSRGRWWPTSPAHQGEHGAAVKTIAQGRPGRSARTCGSCPVHSSRTGAMGAACTRSSLRPPRIEGGPARTNSGQSCRENVEMCLGRVGWAKRTSRTEAYPRKGKSVPTAQRNATERMAGTPLRVHPTGLHPSIAQPFSRPLLWR